MKVLVTGATGFIGSEIVARLTAENFEVLGLSKSAGRHESGIEILGVDITDEKSLRGMEESFEAVIHCAGLAHQFGRIEKEKFENVNIRGTKNIAELAARQGAGHFIFLSSTAVYGLRKSALDETSECRPESVYAESKLKAEEICRKICEKNNIPLTIFRPAPVLGEKGVGNVPRLIEAISKKRFVWVGKGENKKSLIYVGDVADACLRLLREKKNATEIYNLAAPPVTMRALVSVISQKLKRPVPKFSIPVFIPKAVFGINRKSLKLKIIERISGTFEKWISEDIYLADKIKKDYGFVPKTKVSQAVARQCDWFVKKNSG